MLGDQTNTIIFQLESLDTFVLLKNDIPVGKVFPYKWTSPNENAVVVEDDGINNIVSESTRGRIRKNNDFFSP